jgi:WD40 repeat protein
MFGVKSGRVTDRTLTDCWHFDVGQYILDLAWSPTGRQLALVTVEGRVFVVDQADGAGVLRRVGAHERGATSVDWRADGEQFATSGQDGWIKIWDPGSLELRQQLPAGAEWVAKVAYQPGEQRLASAAGKSLRIWSPDGELEYESDDHASTIADIGWNPDGSGIAVAAYYGLTLHIPGRQARTRKYQWKGSSLVLAWSPTAKYIATGEQDSTVHFWHVESGKDAQMWGFATKVLQLSWHHSGGFLATGGSDTVILWDCSDPGPEGRKPWMFEGHLTRLTQLAFQHRGELLASSDDDGFLRVWNPQASDSPVDMRTFPSAISRMAWSPDDRLLAVGQETGGISGMAAGLAAAPHRPRVGGSGFGN